MKSSAILAIFFSLLPLLACIEKNVYIVYFGEHSKEVKTFHEIENYHTSFLQYVKRTEEDARASLLYSYKHSVNGFAAVLTKDEATKLSEMEEVVTVIKSKPEQYSLHTTRSWQFSGLEDRNTQWNGFYNQEEDLPEKARNGKDVIVGLLDSGVWPESRSFNDQGMGPVPQSWKGICQTGPGFNSSHCNKKLIGARYYIKEYEHSKGPLNTTLDYRSPRDMDGHGTHTASTVGGRRVPNASAIGGFANGTASGGVPLARLSIYKVCWPKPGQEKVYGNICMGADMLAAIDDAIADGVDVLSISIGTQAAPFQGDAMSIGAFHATKNNIVVACSAGNDGPSGSSATNIAPWMITVGASSIDRSFVAPVVLGNGMVIKGQSITPYMLQGMHQLVYAGDVVMPIFPKDQTAGQCLPGSLSPEKTKGKIVFCLADYGSRVERGIEVKRAGGVGLIIAFAGTDFFVDAHVLPATGVAYEDVDKIQKYINSTKKPMAMIKYGTTVLNVEPAPAMGGFSSRGPNAIDPYILKPDITAPGVNIMAAWSGGSSPTRLSSDHRKVDYNIISGTSMSCPHVAAAAALVKSVHPNWSSAAIRSALMTTAFAENSKGLPITDVYGNPATPFAYGSGHFRPAKAVDPGLVYDTSYTDYILYCCHLGVRLWDPKEFKCPKELPPRYNLNYPSIAIPKLNSTVTVTRTVTNVGHFKSVYSSTVKPPPGFSITITPSTLSFNRIGERKSFNITIKQIQGAPPSMAVDDYAFGLYTWSDGFYNVTSPMAILS